MIYLDCARCQANAVLVVWVNMLCIRTVWAIHYTYILANCGLPQHIYYDIAGVPVIPRLAMTDCTVAAPTKPVTSTILF